MIPCYNAEAWIEKCIRSALEQDCPNKEVIVVDDGSTDASSKVIRSFGDRIQFYPRLHLGGNAARNQLTSYARGEWVQYLDADDYLLPGKLMSQLGALGDRTKATDVIYSPVVYENSSRPREDQISRIGEGDVFVHFIQWTPFQTSGMLFRREAVLEVGGWRNEQPCCQEHELLLRLLFAEYNFLSTPEAGAVYCFHGEPTVSRKDPLRVIRMRMELTDRVAQYLELAGRLTLAHKAALFAAFMESARSAYRWNTQLAEELRDKAFATGIWRVPASPALPLGYQVMMRSIGFQRAERLAAWLRHRKRVTRGES